MSQKVISIRKLETNLELPESKVHIYIHIQLN